MCDYVTNAAIFICNLKARPHQRMLQSRMRPYSMRWCGRALRFTDRHDLVGDGSCEITVGQATIVRQRRSLRDMP